ncbi:MAG: hypothetical protein ACTS6A_01210 [Candidatus Hodgkinia cicadicola]
MPRAAYESNFRPQTSFRLLSWISILTPFSGFTISLKIYISLKLAALPFPIIIGDPPSGSRNVPITFKPIAAPPPFGLTSLETKLTINPFSLPLASIDLTSKPKDSSITEVGSLNRSERIILPRHRRISNEVGNSSLVSSDWRLRERRTTRLLTFVRHFEMKVSFLNQLAPR